jgi:chromosome partitioning protein
MPDWSDIFSRISVGVNQANLNNILIVPFLAELGYKTGRNCSANQQFTGKINGQTVRLAPDYTCWQTSPMNGSPFLVVEVKRVLPRISPKAIDQVQAQMLVTKATFGLAIDGLSCQLFQRHGKICVPRTLIRELSVETIEEVLAEIKGHLNKPKTALTAMFWNNKGGVGKTTITANVAASLVLEGKKVLVINYDLQGDLNTVFGCEKMANHQPPVTFAELLKVISHEGDIPFDQLIVKKSVNISNRMLAPAQSYTIDLILGDKSSHTLRSILEREDKLFLYLIDRYLSYSYDYILIDLTPDWNSGQLVALATDIYFPVIDNDTLAVDAFLRTLTFLKTLEPIAHEAGTNMPIIGAKIFNPRLQNRGTIVTTQKRVESQLGETIDSGLVINNYNEINNALSVGLPIVFQRPNSPSAKIFKNITQQLFLDHS